MAHEGKPELHIITDLREKFLEDRRLEFAEKTVELQLKKDLLHFYSETIQQKKTILDVEEEKLEEIEEIIYNTENDFCESIWKFSREHDFCNFLNNYPKVKNLTACNCEFLRETVEKKEKELQENLDIKNLTLEIEALKIELETLAADKSLEEEIEKASNQLKLSYNEDQEMQKLYTVLQNSQQELEFLQTEIANYSQNEDSLLRNTEINASPVKRRKMNTDKEKLSTKSTFCQETSGVIKNSPMTCPNVLEKIQKGNNEILIKVKAPQKFKLPSKSREIKNPPLVYSNTIDNYLIIKGNNPVITEETTQNVNKHQLISELKTSNEIKPQIKTGILDSWNQYHISDDNISFTNIENSINEACTFLEKSKKKLPKDIFCEPPNKLEHEKFDKSVLVTPRPSNFENCETSSLLDEQKPIFTQSKFPVKPETVDFEKTELFSSKSPMFESLQTNSLTTEQKSVSISFTSKALPIKQEINDFQKSIFVSKASIFESPQTKPLLTEQKSISRSFTPRKQSAISEKLLKFH